MSSFRFQVQSSRFESLCGRLFIVGFSKYEVTVGPSGQMGGGERKPGCCQ